jgi:hypothetical protein
MPVPIPHLDSFSPKSDFLKELIDVAADAVTKEATGETVEGNEREMQRQVFIKMTSQLACLRGKGVVNTILSELEWAETNRDFLDAMKRIESSIWRIRRRLAELQILEPTRDVLSPLQFKRATTARSVSLMQRLTAETTTRDGQLAVSFINHVLPHLAKKYEEVERWAHQVGEPVFRDDHDFSLETYGTRKIPTSSATNLERRLWNGVSLPNRSEYAPKLLKLSMDPQYLDRLITFEELTKVLSDDPATPINLGALKQGIIKIDNLFKEAWRPLPYQKIHGQWIRFGEVSDVSAQPVPENNTFVPNDAFLDQKLTLSSEETNHSNSQDEFTLDSIAQLWLSPDAAKILEYLMRNEWKMQQVSSVITAVGGNPNTALNMETLKTEINTALAQRTQKKVNIAGKHIIFSGLQ